ncbi:hypothetical protein Btru_005662 [Bulinus truncatus]|nr:hypothetical protein Btru_005662 [Bulinus truncatus]
MIPRCTNSPKSNTWPPLIEVWVDSPSVINGVAAHEPSAKDAPIRSLQEIPGPNGLHSLPFIGSMFLFYPFTTYKPEKSYMMFADLHKRFGPIVKFRKGWNWSVLLFHPDLIEEAMSYEGRCPNRPSPPLIDSFSARTGRCKGISQVQGEEWLNMRRPLQEFLLQPSNSSVYIPVLNQISNDLVMTITDKLEEDGHIILENLMLRYAVESSAMYCINTRLHFLQTGSNDQDSSIDQNPVASRLELTVDERNELLKMIRTVMSTVGAGYYTFPLYKYMKTKLYLKYEMAINFITRVVQQKLSLIAEALKRNENNVADKMNQMPNLLQTLLSDGRLDFNTCVSLVTGFFTTATDNISKSLTMILWHLARNHSKQETLRQEIISKFGSNELISADELSHMPYLKACLKESHRLTYPTPLGTIRIMPEDINLAGYHIPAGTCISYGHNVLGHSAEYFADPTEYRPERWMKSLTLDTERTLRHQQAIITMPFGFGKRNCVGRRLAEQQIYLAVIKILQNYRLEMADPEETLDIEYRITVTPSKPLDIRFLPLNRTDINKKCQPIRHKHTVSSTQKNSLS